MLRRIHLRPGALLIVAALAGGAFLGIPIVGWPQAVMLRGFLLGIVGGLFGASLFAAGHALGRGQEVSEETGPAAESDEPAVRSAPDAKYWLRKFLEEHRASEEGREETTPRP